MANKKSLWGNEPIKISYLRKHTEIIPKEPGLYKFWCKEKEFRFLLGKLESFRDEKSKVTINFDSVKPYAETYSLKSGETLYCVYVGKAKSLYERIKKKHLNGSPRNSTVRKTLKGLLKTDKGKVDREALDAFMDKLYIQFEEYKLENISDAEKGMINLKHYIRILNGSDLSDADVYKAQNGNVELREVIKVSRRKARKL